MINPEFLARHLEQFKTTYAQFKRDLHKQETTCLVVAWRRLELYEGEERAIREASFNEWLFNTVNKCIVEHINKCESYPTLATSQGLKRYHEETDSYSYYSHQPGTLYYKLKANIFLVDAGSHVLIYRNDSYTIPF